MELVPQRLCRLDESEATSEMATWSPPSTDICYRVNYHLWPTLIIRIYSVLWFLCNKTQIYIKYPSTLHNIVKG